MRIYILPAGTDQFPKNYFEDGRIFFRPYDGGISYAPFWNEFYEVCGRKGVSIKSYLDWSVEKGKPDDVLLVLNHPGETLLRRLYYSLRYWKTGGGFFLRRRKFLFENRRFFKKRILMQLEPFVVMPYVYKHLDEMINSGFYEKIFCTTRVERPGVEYFNYFEYRTKNIVSSHFDAPKTKFITMINSNIRPHSFRGELYGERLKAIKFFSQFPGFDLYGFYWNVPVRHPLYFYYGKYVRQSWRGQIPDKLKTLSSYKFAICFENGSYPSWISEKIFDCFAVGVIPVYLGAPDIEKLVPKDCFIDFLKFKNYDELHRYLLSLSEKEMEGYRQSIREFLAIPPKPRLVEKFVEKITG